MFREGFDSATAGLLEEARTFRGRADMFAARIVRIALDFNEAAALQSCDDAAHGWRLDLLGGGEFSERF